MTFQGFMMRFEAAKKTGKGFIVKCPAHEDKQASLSVVEGNNGAILLKCFAGCALEDIVRALDLEVKDLFIEQQNRNLSPIFNPYKRPTRQNQTTNILPSDSSEPEQKSEIERIYSYTDQLGRELYQAIRLKPKSFRQRHSVDGKWHWNMDGVERVLFQLPLVLAAQTVFVVEGEKDAENLTRLGYVATCNVGGAGKWLDAYTVSLAGKDVILCGDNDKPGQEHIQKVFDSIAGRAKTTKIIKVPNPSKDISDYIATFTGDEQAKAEINEMLSAAVPFVDGVRLPVYTMAEIEPKYRKQVSATSSASLDFTKWLPTLGNRVRPIIPGELVLLIGDTGTGKTAMLQNIAESASSLWSIMFEMELPEELLFERNVAMKQNMEAKEVETEYRKGAMLGESALQFLFPRLLICSESGLTIERIEQLVVKSELKTGEKPQLVLIDYVQLMQAQGSSRYERTSNVAEGLKVLAKSTKTIVVVASQIARPSRQASENSDDEDRCPISLHSAKDAGALENSAGLVIGAWRDKKDFMLMHLKVLKSTKGGSGTQIECNFDGARMRITERSKISDEDVPGDVDSVSRPTQQSFLPPPEEREEP